MTIFYIDPVNGNDASSGVDWANAWKTFANGPTAARIAPGDEMRIAKSPDPEVVGDATWTDGKIGNSITFASAPTKQIDLMDTGWLSSGAGATVTNGQATAYMMWGAVAGTGAALQLTTSATTNGCYKNLGSVQDFSAHQQISFWFRSSSAFDCTGAQNMFIRLCSDTAGTTVVDTLTMPKWSYATNTWYPIVIDKGSALGSNIQSVSITTTNNTSQTFYFDEMFASPANGLTLWSLIEDNEDCWYAIRTIRDADVWLMGVFVPATAAGGTIAVNTLDQSWVGTTATFSTRKRETLKAYGANGPATLTWCQTNEAGVWAYPNKTINQYRFGWNTTTNLQDGHTYIDNLTCLGTFLANTLIGWRFENFVSVRFSNGFSNSGAGVELDNFGFVCNINTSFSTMMSRDTVTDYNKNITILFITGVNNGFSMQFTTSGNTSSGFNINLGKLYCNGGHFTLSNLQKSTVTINTIAGITAYGIALGSGSKNLVTINRMATAASTGFPSGFVNTTSMSSLTDNGSVIKVGTSTNYPWSISGNSILDITTVTGSSPAVHNLANTDAVLRVGTNSSSSTTPWLSFGSNVLNGSLYVQDYNGAGNAAVFVGMGSNSYAGVFGKYELQTADVHTPGSKAWAYSLTLSSGLLIHYLGATNALKLASVAAEANKLVTITCYVKKGADYQDVGIRVPAIFLPGYTSDISTAFTGTVGNWQQLTITFTPTADCVFDVLGYVDYTSGVAATTAVWDDLSITQAA